MIDVLHAVRVPSGEEEALRDLVRAREDVRGDLMRARHWMEKLLLRDDVRYDGVGDNWTHRHTRRTTFPEKWNKVWIKGRGRNALARVGAFGEVRRERPGR